MDHAQEVEPKRQLVDTRLVYVTRQANQVRAAVLRGAQREESGASVADNRRDRAVSFDVIQQGRALPGADHGWKRRLHAGHAALALDRIEQRSLFTALIGTRAGMRINVEI